VGNVCQAEGEEIKTRCVAKIKRAKQKGGKPKGGVEGKGDPGPEGGCKGWESSLSRERMYSKLITCRWESVGWGNLEGGGSIKIDGT